MPTSQTNRLLGYPDDARLLIINADDFGMCHAINEAIFCSMKSGVVRSTSLMVPCPWAIHAMALLRDNPNLSFGVHLTLVCDHVHYKWKPLTSREKVPSLVDETGHFYAYDRIPELLANAKLDDLEIEFRAQIDAAFAAGLQPTHLDWHCLRNGGRDDIFHLSLGLAKEYGLAIRAYDHPFIGQLWSQNLPTDDHELLDSYRLDIDGKAARYSQLLRDLPAGLSEWAVHPGLDTAEMQAVEPGSWQVRYTDYAFVTSPEARQIIEQEGIVLLSYKPLQDVWRQ